MIPRLRKPRILLALPLPPPHSGQERLTEALLRCGLEQSFELIHVDTSLGDDNDARGRFGIRRAWRALDVTRKVVWALIVSRPDVLNVPLAKNRLGFFRSAVLILVGRLFGSHVVSRLGGDHFERFYQGQVRWFQSFIRVTLGSIDALIVRSHGLKRQFEGLVDPSRLHCVYLGLATGDFERPRGWPAPTPDAVRILFVGHISKAKGAFDLLRAIPQIRAEVPNAQFMFAGDRLTMERDVVHVAPRELLTEELNNLLHESVANAVTITKARNLEDLQRLYWDADIFVLPSYSEGFPFSVLEAMAAPLPLVVTPAGALAEVLVPGLNAEMVKAGDVNGIASAVIALALHPEQRRAMAAANSALVNSRFTLEHLRDQMERLYQHVITRPHAHYAARTGGRPGQEPKEQTRQ